MQDNEERIKQLEFKIEKLSPIYNSDWSNIDLIRPFQDNELEWKPQMTGFTKKNEPFVKCVAFADARAIQTRLDTVVGAGNWKNDVQFLPNGVLSTIYLKIGGEWVGKTDGADFSEIEPFKGGMSDAFKRAACLWGIGRYLYDLGENWADLQQSDNRLSDPWRYIVIKDKKNPNNEWKGYWKPSGTSANPNRVVKTIGSKL